MVVSTQDVQIDIKIFNELLAKTVIDTFRVVLYDLTQY